jgi:hypothetical protein
MGEAKNKQQGPRDGEVWMRRAFTGLVATLVTAAVGVAGASGGPLEPRLHAPDPDADRRPGKSYVAEPQASPFAPHGGKR